MPLAVNVAERLWQHRQSNSQDRLVKCAVIEQLWKTPRVLRGFRGRCCLVPSLVVPRLV